MVVVRLGKELEGMLPGREYLMEAAQAGACLMSGAPCTVESTGLATAGIQAFDGRDPEGWDDRRVLVVRPAGIGDLLFLRPVLAEIRRRWPGVRLDLACFERFAQVAENFDELDAVVRYPQTLAEVQDGYDAVLWMEKVVEFNPDAESRHYVDLLLERAGLEGVPEERKRCHWTVSEADAEWAAREVDWSQAPKTVGIQINSSSPARSYPRVRELIGELYGAGLHVVLFGAPGELAAEDQPRLTNLSARVQTVGQSAAVAARCDVVVAPDSAMCHLAAAVGTPVVALYGPFPWRLRTAYHPTVRALSGTGACAPCFWHARGRAFPDVGADGEPARCRLSGRCEVLASIDPARVVREVLKMMAEQKGDQS